MASSRLIFFFFSIFLYLIALTVAQQNTLPLENFCISDQGNFTTNSTYQANLNHLLSTLTSDTKIDYGFYNSSYGRNSNQVNAIALCRGDVKPDSCRSCINTSALELPKLCPNHKEAVIWYDNCMLRYSNRYFFGDMEFGPWFWMYNVINVSDANTFNQAVGTLLDNLKNQAASGGPLRKFATGNATTSKSQTIYALAQCTPDLSKQQCIDCLNNATALLPQCCNGRQGGRVIAPSCNFRYEIDHFYADTAEAPTTSPSPSPPTSPPPTSQPPASPDESPSPPTPPPPSEPPPSPDESPSPPTSEPPSSPDESPSPATSEPSSSPDESPPPATSPPPTSEPPSSPDESPPPPPSTPTAQPAAPPTNSSIQDGNASHDTSPTFVLVIIPLLLSLYLPSVSAYF